MYETVKNPYRTGCEVHNRNCQLRNFRKFKAQPSSEQSLVLDQVAYEHEARGVMNLKI